MSTATAKVPLLNEETGRFDDKYAPPSVAQDASVAEAARVAAVSARQGAEAAKTAVDTAAGQAATAATTATGAATTATTAAGMASSAATAAGTSAGTASTAATTATGAATAAGTARDGAVSARTAAETARDQAQAALASKGQANGLGSLTDVGRQPDNEVNANLTPQALLSTIGAAVTEGVAPKANAADVYSKTAANTTFAPMSVKDTVETGRLSDASVSSKINTAVPPAVAQAIANDPSVSQKAADLAQSSAGLVQKTDARLPREVPGDVLWMLHDSDWKSPLFVMKDGTTRIAAPVIAGGLSFGSIDPVLSGGFAGFSSADRWSELVVTEQGRVPAWAARRITGRGAVGTGLIAGPGIAAWGDSITHGGQDLTSVVSYVAARFGVPFYNGGWPSQGATSIAQRQGGSRAQITVAGGVIPASGPVTITVNPSPIDNPNTSYRATERGALAQVPGTLSWSGGASGDMIFTRDTAGDAVTLTGPVPFVPESGSTRRTWVQLLWAGRNGVTDVAGILDQTRKMVAYQGAAVPRFLVLQIVPGVGWADPAPANTALRNEYPENYVAVADWLRTDAAAASVAYTLTTDDRADIASGVTPRGFREDAVHLNALGRKAVANRVIDEFTTRGWMQ